MTVALTVALARNDIVIVALAVALARTDIVTVADDDAATLAVV